VKKYAKSNFIIIIIVNNLSLSRDERLNSPPADAVFGTSAVVCSL